MGQSNVAREPSMEEILASIRKIIESNDDEEGAPAPVEAQPGAAAENERSEAKSPTAIKAANEQTGPDTAMSAEQAKIRLNAARSQPSGQSRPAAGPVAASPRPKVVKPGIVQSAQAEENKRPVSLAEVAAEAENSSRSEIEDAIREQLEASVASELSEPQDSAPAGPEAAPLRGSGKSGPGGEVQKNQHHGRPSPANGRPAQGHGRALISPEAGAKVAASFDGLSHALVKGPDRSFDEIAEDMLRPMLQQWLDDNLPTLVERLVREEIERVARGS